MSEATNEYYLKTLEWVKIPNLDMLTWVSTNRSKDPLLEIAQFGLNELNQITMFYSYSTGEKLTDSGVMIGFSTEENKKIFEDRFLSPLQEKKKAEILEFPQDK